MKVIAGLIASISIVLAGCGGAGAGGSSSCGALTLFFGWVAGGACPAVSATVTTFAGTANSTGSADGTYFSGSADNVALDSVGNIYVTGLFSNAIRKITPTGVVTTFAGMQEPLRNLKGGFADGTGAAARFQSPRGIAVDSNDNVYVADSGNSTIRKITSAGVVTTFAGTAGQIGSADGTGAAARFQYPAGIAVDSNGNAYVSDTYNYTVRKINSAGVVTTFAGTAGQQGSADGTGAAARFQYPGGIAVDSSGNVYVADGKGIVFRYGMASNSIRKITPAGLVTTIAGGVSGGSADGNGAAASFNGVRGVAVDSSGNIFVADEDNSTIRKITPSGEVTTLAGSAEITDYVDGTGAAARFNRTRDVAVDPNGNVYVADRANAAIRKITPAGVVTTIVGRDALLGFDTSYLSLGSAADGNGAAARFRFPQGVAVDSNGNVHVADSGNSTIRKITSAGVVTTFAGTAGQQGSADGTGAAARFKSPSGIAIDSSGNAYVADNSGSTIRKISPAGAVTTLAGTAGVTGSADGIGALARFNLLQGVTVDSNNNVYVADSENATIRKVTTAAVVTTFAGTAGSRGSADGVGAAARFDVPLSVAVDPSGNFYLADVGNHTIRKITSAGVVTTFAGTAGIAGSADGTGAAARFDYPVGVTVDSSGNIYVADWGNATIRKITSAGVVTTLAGTAGKRGFADGNGVDSKFGYPWGVAIDSSNNALYVTDLLKSTVRKITLVP